MTEESEKDKRRSVVTSLPSDYSDVQPRNYDPDFISNISNKMQVPDSIRAFEGGDSYHVYDRSWDEQYTQPQHMNVPERIMLAGGGVHIGGRTDIKLHFDNIQMGTYDEPVGLRTPPRVLTMEERFPGFEDEDENELKQYTPRPQRVPNGTVPVPAPYTPGMSASDSLLLNEEDEATQLRTQVAKLSRRITAMEKDRADQTRMYYMLHSATLGLLITPYMLKFLRWVIRGD